jgi:hypothetical protein
MDLIRRLLLELEGRPHGERPQPIVLADVDPALVDGHLELLIDADYIRAIEDTTLRRPKFQRFTPTRLTSSGHDFLAAIRRDDVWEKVKEKAKAEGTDLPFSVIKDLALAALRMMIGLG